MSQLVNEPLTDLIPIDNVEIETGGSSSSSSSTSSSSSSTPSSSSSSVATPSSSSATPSSSSMALATSPAPGFSPSAGATHAFRATSTPITVVAGSSFTVKVALASVPSSPYTLKVECLTTNGDPVTPVAALQYLVVGPGAQTATTGPFYVPTNASGSLLVRASQLDDSQHEEVTVNITAP